MVDSVFLSSYCMDLVVNRVMNLFLLSPNASYAGLVVEIEGLVSVSEQNTVVFKNKFEAIELMV